MTWQSPVPIPNWSEVANILATIRTQQTQPNFDQPPYGFQAAAFGPPAQYAPLEVTMDDTRGRRTPSPPRYSAPAPERRHDERQRYDQRPPAAEPRYDRPQSAPRRAPLPSYRATSHRRDDRRSRDREPPRREDVVRHRPRAEPVRPARQDVRLETVQPPPPPPIVDDIEEYDPEAAPIMPVEDHLGEGTHGWLVRLSNVDARCGAEEIARMVSVVSRDRMLALASADRDGPDVACDSRAYMAFLANRSTAAAVAAHLNKVDFNGKRMRAVAFDSAVKKDVPGAKQPCVRRAEDGSWRTVVPTVLAMATPTSSAPAAPIAVTQPREEEVICSGNTAPVGANAEEPTTQPPRMGAAERMRRAMRRHPLGERPDT